MVEGVDERGMVAAALYILQPRILLVTGNFGIIFAENSGKFGNIFRPPAAYQRRRGIHYNLDGFKQHGIREAIAQHAVALFERLIVSDKRIEVGRVGLRYYHVDKTAALFRPFGNQTLVGRC